MTYCLCQMVVTELVTGLKPQGPLHQLFKRIVPTVVVDPRSDVAGLREHLMKIHDAVRLQLQGDRAVRKQKAETGEHKAISAPPSGNELHCVGVPCRQMAL